MIYVSIWFDFSKRQNFQEWNLVFYILPYFRGNLSKGKKNDNLLQRKNTFFNYFVSAALFRLDIKQLNGAVHFAQFSLKPTEGSSEKSNKIEVLE